MFRNHKTFNYGEDLYRFWCLNEYQNDHISILIEREKILKSIKYSSPQLEHRKTLIELMKNVAIKKKLTYQSIYLGVYILDVFMDSHNIVIERLELIAVVSLLLATKFEEADTNILKATELNIYIKTTYSLSDYFTLEMMILKHLDWNLNIPTVANLVYNLLVFLYSKEDIIYLSPHKSESELWFDTRRLLTKYFDYIVDDMQLMYNKPSLVSAAILVCIRAKFSLKKIWPSQLMTVTGYKLFELKVIISRLKQVYVDNIC